MTDDGWCQEPRCHRVIIVILTIPDTAVDSVDSVDSVDIIHYPPDIYKCGEPELLVPHCCDARLSGQSQVPVTTRHVSDV